MLVTDELMRISPPEFGQLGFENKDSRPGSPWVVAQYLVQEDEIPKVRSSSVQQLQAQ